MASLYLLFLIGGLLVAAIAVAVLMNDRVRSLAGRVRAVEDEIKAVRGLAASDASFQPPPIPEVEPEPRPVSVASPPTPLPDSPPPIAAEARQRYGTILGDLELNLGGRLPVWIGAIALVLAAAFLVKLSIDLGWIGPPVRLGLGLAAGLGMLYGGHRGRSTVPLVAQGLSAAGIATLFVSLYAGINVYHLIPSLMGFLLMAATTACAVMLSLRQGPIVAAIGLLGGLLTPQLVQFAGTDERVLFGYLLILQAGLLPVARRRGWWALAAAGFVGGLFWFVFWLGAAPHPFNSFWLAVFLLASVSLFVAGPVLLGEDRISGPTDPRSRLQWLAVTGGLAGMALLTFRGGMATQEWIFLAVLSTGLLVLARLESRLLYLGAVVAAAVGLCLLVWCAGLENADATRFLWTVTGFALLFAGASYAALWSSPTPIFWAWLSAASGVISLLIAYWGSVRVGVDLPWGWICLIAASLYIWSAVPIWQRRLERPDVALAISPLAAGSTTLVSLAVPTALEQPTLTVAWAIEVPVLFWLAGRLGVPVLRTLAAVIAALVTLQLVGNTEALVYGAGGWPILNGLLYAYGIPALALAVAAYLAATQGEHGHSEALQWGSFLLGFLLLTWEVRHFFHPGEIISGAFELTEMGALSVVWLLAAVGLLKAARRWPLRVLSLGGAGLAALATIQAVTSQGLALNPLWSHLPVGEVPLWNSLLWVYGAPALLMVLVARRWKSAGRNRFSLALRFVSLVFVLLLVTSQVRQYFHGSFLDGGEVLSAEHYAYSISWILLGLTLLVVGVLRQGQMLRFASLAVMTLAVGKVFLIDIGHLGGLYRVLSFFGLGVSLLFLAYLYQRFVFRESTV